ncbi:MAG: glycine--tRNA ligase subunit beta [Rhodospirillales bacterium]|nr:glycine--tRNA ligase subunit beta [Rhodospirillales bacterium]MDE0380623.1 glycine--tRNA ligase subunit beta [Rhodospirillales bacterium]
MPDLLLEVLSEEIPARMQAGGSDELKRQVLRRLEEARLEFDAEDVKSYATPRRLALIVPGLPAVQPDITVERKGPRVDAPEKAIQGFLKSTGLTLDDCEQRETPKGPVWFAVKQEEGRPTADLLADLLPQALAAVSWPKSMRWDESGIRWVRPIRSILCLLGDQVVPFRFGSVQSGRTTLGHRFLSSGSLTIADVDSYAATVEKAKVMLEPERRAREIEANAKALAAGEDLLLVEDDWLVAENAGLVEWPVVLPGTIDERLLDLPQEVPRSAMRKHQRYFSLRSADPIIKLAPRFVMVANTDIGDGGTAVVAGNERVLRARLADARFFWDQDRRRRLEEQLPALEGVVFHARLGSMRKKADRIARLAHILCPAISAANPDDAARAGLLCKADLVTEMVGEFPDLQGTMGRYYARLDGEEHSVFEAIADHHSPKGLGDSCPTAPVSVAVALADKLDTLAGFFAIDERPTGSKDPFALRRAAIGAIRLIIENVYSLPLKRAFSNALAGYNGILPEEPGPEATRDALLAFFVDRVKIDLRKRGVRHDWVSAVFGASGEDDLVRLLARVLAFGRFLDSEDGTNLLIAYRRAANILRIEEKKDGQSYEGEPDTDLFDKDKAEERTLHKRIAIANTTVEFALAQANFEAAMKSMAELRKPVDAFFDNVTVNCEDPALRRNRLLMLSQIRSTLDRVADFSKIEG